ncbi:XRE family transcriptional regulator [Streptomyces pathocidini]|uniref:XRE family transcriptional regulator n=1 Tax=Streptomyces pathocidini TaxID=1650571 RepID=A0ABW7UQT5_9ACTN
MHDFQPRNDHAQPPESDGPEHRHPPFDARAARRLREALGMTHSHVAYGIWAAYGVRLGPATVAAWELGEESPTEAQLTALAGALWCAPGDLLGTPTTLREHRMSAGFAATDLALRIGMEPAVYERIERTGEWYGNDRQAGALAEALALPLPAFIGLTGQADRLSELLRSAVTTRWQAYVKPVAKVLGLARGEVEDALRQLHSDYQSRMVGTLNWGVGRSASDSGDAGQIFLDEVLDLFWDRLYRSRDGKEG